MNYPEQISKLYRDMVHGGSIAGVSFHELLDDITWQEATTKVGNCNTIATLVFHVQYYVRLVSRVLAGGPIEGNDALSFVHPPIASEADWNNLLDNTWKETAVFTELVANLSEKQLQEPFEAYGTYYRNIHGIIEHTHYHLGQISLLKKLIREGYNT